MKISCILTLLLGALFVSGKQTASAQVAVDQPSCPGAQDCLQLFKRGQEQSDQSNRREAQRLYPQTVEELPDCPSDLVCLSLFQQGREQSEQGNLREAQRLYLAAYQVRADPSIFFSIARVLHKQGRLTQAALYYQRFLDSPVEEPELKRKAQEYRTMLSLHAQTEPPMLREVDEQGQLDVKSSSARSLSASQRDPLPTSSIVISPGPAAPVLLRPMHKRPWVWVTAGAVLAAWTIGGAVAAWPRQGQSNPGLPSYSIFALTVGGVQ
jgi:hypothetical protein